MADNTMDREWKTMLEEHRELMLQIAAVRDWVHQVAEFGIPHFGELGTRLGPLREELAAHFAEEEEGGYLTLALSIAPHHTAEAVELRQQHARFLDWMDALIDRLRDANPPFAGWEEASQEFEDLLTEIRQHEARETSIVNEVIGDSESARRTTREHALPDEELVTVYTLTDANRAELIKTELAAEGIECQIDGENQAGLSHILEIGLLVRAADADRARSFIEAHEEPAR